jgi:hypothetical protein
VGSTGGAGGGIEGGAGSDGLVGSTGGAGGGIEGGAGSDGLVGSTGGAGEPDDTGSAGGVGACWTGVVVVLEAWSDWAVCAGVAGVEVELNGCKPACEVKAIGGS